MYADCPFQGSSYSPEWHMDEQLWCISTLVCLFMFIYFFPVPLGCAHEKWIMAWSCCRLWELEHVHTHGLYVVCFSTLHWARIYLSTHNFLFIFHHSPKNSDMLNKYCWIRMMQLFASRVKLNRDSTGAYTSLPQRANTITTISVVLKYSWEKHTIAEVMLPCKVL